MVTADEMALVDELAADLGVRRDRPVRRTACTVDGFTTSALRWGSRPSRTVLVHGGSMNAHAWDALLLQTPLDALAVDLPGHGCSDWFEEPVYVPEDLAGILAPALEALAPSATTVVGHSLGGLTALALAATRPELVPRLVLVDVSPEPRPDRSAALRSVVSRDVFASFDAMVACVADDARGDSRALRRKLLLNARQLPDGTWSWRHDARSLPGADKWQAVFEALPRGWEHAAAVRCPTLLLRGADSDVLSEDDVHRYARLVPDLAVRVFAGAGHQLPGERAREVGEAVAAVAHAQP